MYGGAGPEIFGDPPPRSLVWVKRKTDEFPASARTVKAGPLLDIAVFYDGELLRGDHRPVWYLWCAGRQKIETQKMQPTEKSCDHVFHVSSPHPKMVACQRGRASLPGCNKGNPVAVQPRAYVRLGREIAACGLATYRPLRQVRLYPPTTH